MTHESQRRGRVLVIDDERPVAVAIQRTLHKHHDVVICTSSPDALQRLLSGEAFDAIICDLMMPQLTGMDVHAELMKVMPELARRMIFLTGGAFTAEARAFLDDASNVHIEKPFDAEQLRALVNDRVR
ncbi:MAG: response regulator [Archangium sp.]|nr:response regulator [Archangium sp.]MDP3156365.1 response regulator [Archangium sp.]MDP3570409.1 response regulator [Archangium sp.]